MASRLLHTVQPQKSNRIKTPEAPDQSPEDLHPIFSLANLKGKFCLSKCDKIHKAAFANTLHTLGKLTWSQIRKSDRHKLGYEHIPLKKIKGTVPKEFSDKEKALVFRFKGLAPMAGFREGQTYHIVWLDPKFKLYTHGKKKKKR